MDLIIIGGGAAGIFAAINFAETYPRKKALILEQSQQVLSKVKISGGGRCNVTHSCFDPRQLVQNYPRGNQELLGPFSRFQPSDIVNWFESRGVPLKTEADGRMFPKTNQSQTIIDCLLKAATDAGVVIQKGAKVVDVDMGFKIYLKSGETLTAKKIMIATGSSRFGYDLVQKLGHTVINPVPSLFTFNIPNSPFHKLTGVSVDDAIVTLPELKMSQKAPLLITHWGFSGPAVLKLSAWAARELHELSYNTPVMIDWCPNGIEFPKESSKSIFNEPIKYLPKKLWATLLTLSKIDGNKKWQQISRKQRVCLQQNIKQTLVTMSGKTTFKQEFVTCGGVKLSEVNFKTMESKLVPNLYFGGEVLDIDGVTGGFNFQAAWTCGWIAGNQLDS